MTFETLPDHSRLWLRALEAPPEGGALAELQEGLAAIMETWRHKGQVYHGACALLHGQIIAIAEPASATAPSGCAIDGMLRKVERLADQLSLPRVDPATTVLARVEQALKPIPKADLPQALEQGLLTPATPILDLSLYTLGDLRSGRLEAPLATTWIARKYPVGA